MLKSYLIDKLAIILLNNNICIELIGKEEKESLKNELKIILQLSNGKPFNKQEKKLIKTHIWHLFSYKIMSCHSNEDAISSFNNLYLKDFIILTNYPNSFSIRCLNKGNLIDASLLNDLLLKNHHNHDVYIFHPNFNWLYTIPHEKIVGPYFIRL